MISLLKWGSHILALIVMNIFDIFRGKGLIKKKWFWLSSQTTNTKKSHPKASPSDAIF